MLKNTWIFFFNQTNLLNLLNIPRDFHLELCTPVLTICAAEWMLQIQPETKYIQTHLLLIVYLAARVRMQLAFTFIVKGNEALALEVNSKTQWCILWMRPLSFPKTAD